MGKGELLIKGNFSFPHSVFYPIGEHIPSLIKFKIVLFQFGRVKKSFVKELTFNPSPDDTILVLSKLKAFADDKRNVTQNITFVVDSG